MASPPRSTRSRTRALRRLSNEKPKPIEPTSVSEDTPTDSVDASEEEGQWEDVSEAQEETNTPSKPSRRDSASPVSIRRPTLSTPRRRKRVRNGLTPTHKLLTASGVIINSDANTPTKEGTPIPPEVKREESPQSDTLFQDERKSPQPNTLEHKSPDPTPPTRAQSVPIFSKEDLVDGAVQSVSFSSRYLFDVCRTALVLLRKPLGFLLFFYLLASALSIISQTLREAFAPICWLPFISSSLMCQPIQVMPPPNVNYPALMEAETKTFEQLLDEASGGSALSLEVKKAEMATSDLVTLVHLSSLTSKETIARMLLDFVEDAKKTGRRLQKLHSKVGGAVDTIMAVNDHALRTIEKANDKNGILSFDVIPWIEQRKTRVVTATFNDAMNTLSSQVERLIIEAEVNIENLNDLEERLNALNELVAREVEGVEGDREELLALLWTMLGGHRKELKNFNKNLAILKNVKTYRNQARLHVTATLQTLQSLSEDMEEMRERVATPGLVGERIPLEVQMKSIQFGLDRLKENRMRARRSHEAAVQAVTGLGMNEIDA
ncbi:hypothetical protein NP233_g12675 [Leucocoprinus birnbaumii]|uniref:Uncharacterized protein n=1 Tax=Leucocoprinus birnbaumii TaxID=56174 RepID=A0AAD5YJ92_9AGAR|nr:hypothetical protein NP233_g12675 [Leucocoprinus birnbaumii]